MPIQFPDMMPVPTAEEHRPFLNQLMKGIMLNEQMQQFPEQLQQQKLANALRQIELRYAPQTAEANLQAKELENEKLRTLMPTLLPKAQADLKGSEALAKYHEEEANKLKYLSKSGYVTPDMKAQIENHQAQADYHKAQTEKLRLETQELQKSLQRAQKSNGEIGKSEPSIYGITTPKPTPEDIINKTLYGMDTFTPRYKDAIQKQLDEKKKIQQISNNTSASLNAANKQINLFNEYDQLMDSSWEAGPRLGLIPPWFTSGTGKTIDNLTSEMASFGIENVKQALGPTARFAIPEFQLALTQKPQRTWDKGTRNDYGSRLRATKKSLENLSKIDSYIENNPQLGVSSSDLQAIKNAYQSAYPMVYTTGKKRGQINWENLGDQWEEFVTPKAIEAIKNGKEFKPEKKGKEGNYWIRDNSGKLVLKGNA